ncbi:hypothetical protein D3C77_625290 [compost metagenome]
MRAFSPFVPGIDKYKFLVRAVFRVAVSIVANERKPLFVTEQAESMEGVTIILFSSCIVP